MKIVREISLSDFEFWGGAKETAKYLTTEDFDTIEQSLEDEVAASGEYPYTETQLNDLFCFEEDYIAQILGYEDWADLINDRED